jgi:hypothetical protein
VREEESGRGVIEFSVIAALDTLDGASKLSVPWGWGTFGTKPNSHPGHVQGGSPGPRDTIHQPGVNSSKKDDEDTPLAKS